MKNLATALAIALSLLGVLSVGPAPTLGQQAQLANLVQNGDFDTNADGWENAPTWSAEPSPGTSGSGTARLMTAPIDERSGGRAIWQCIRVEAGQPYLFSASVNVPAPQPRRPTAQVFLEEYASASCEGSSSPTNAGQLIVVESGSGWRREARIQRLLGTTNAVRIYLQEVWAQALPGEPLTPTIEASFDNAFVSKAPFQTFVLAAARD